MAKHSLSPGFVKIAYTAHAHTHKMVLPVSPVLVGATWELEKPVGIGNWTPWTDGVDSFVAKMKPFINTADAINSAELYTVATPSSPPIFRATYTIGVSGTDATAAAANGQAVFSWRLDNGSLAKLYIMEPGSTMNIHLAYPTGTAIVDAMFDWFTGVDSFVFGRDLGVPISGIFFTTKINDKLRRKYLLNV